MGTGFGFITGSIIGAAGLQIYHSSQDQSLELALVQEQLVAAMSRLELFDTTKAELDKALKAQQRLLALYQTALTELEILRSAAGSKPADEVKVAQLLEINALIRKELDATTEALKHAQNAADREKKEALAIINGSMKTEYYTTAVAVKAGDMQSIDLHRDEQGILRKTNRTMLKVNKLIRWHRTSPMSEPIRSDCVPKAAAAPLSLSCNTMGNEEGMHGLYIGLSQDVMIANPAIGVLIEFDEENMPIAHRNHLIVYPTMWKSSDIPNTQWHRSRLIPNTMRWVRSNVLEVVVRGCPDANTKTYYNTNNQSEWSGYLEVHASREADWNTGFLLGFKTTADANTVMYVRSLSVFSAQLVPGTLGIGTGANLQRTLRWYTRHL